MKLAAARSLPVQRTLRQVSSFSKRDHLWRQMLLRLSMRRVMAVMFVLSICALSHRFHRSVRPQFSDGRVRRRLRHHLVRHFCTRLLLFSPSVYAHRHMTFAAQHLPYRHGENAPHRADRPAAALVRQALLSPYICNTLSRYAGPVDCARQIIARDGFKGLYRGLKVNFIGVMPEKAIKLAVNDACRNHFLQANSGAPVTIVQGRRSSSSRLG
jgi:hypothetical protein